MDITLDTNKRYTYADYLTWIDNQTRELLDGFIRLMSPAPTLTQAKISRKLLLFLGNYIEKNNGKCQVFTAPFDVRLPQKPDEVADDKIYTVVQPDLCIVCDESKLDERGCLGAPDMVVEILSLSSQKYDLNEKCFIEIKFASIVNLHFYNSRNSLSGYSPASIRAWILSTTF
ncbi:MAG: Uma2 family endonuclease [Tannerella sp.]|jgi:Uma2 family endonuclease|nr:Uma2 family endonuclease [Tannerella sp.]